MLDTQSTKKEKIRYKRDTDGHLMCHLCDFKPNPTTSHPKGNPSTLCHHIQKQHKGSQDLSHVCKKCGHGFLHKLALDTHIASRHPEMNQKVEMFKCDVQGCEYESLTRGNLEIHKARKHYSELVSKCLTILEIDTKKIQRCLCCARDFNSPSHFHYHIAKDYENHKDFTI